MPREGIGATQREREVVTSHRWQAKRPVLGIALALLSAAIWAEPARAGTYVMRNCDVPGYGSSPMTPWIRPDRVLTTGAIVDGCATGGGVSFALNDAHQVKREMSLQLQRPTGSRGEIEFVKAVLWYAARLSGTGPAIHFYSMDVHSDGSLHDGLSNIPPGSESVIAEQGLSPATSYYEFGLHCGPLSGENLSEPCIAASGVPLFVRGMEVTLREDVPPALGAPGGSLLEGGPQSGLRTLSYAASDPQSGLSKVEVLLDQSVVASQDLTTTRCAYSDFTVCPESLDESLQIDTRLVANGSYTLRVRAQDAAGNERVVESGRRIEVANQPSSTAPTTPAYKVVARFAGAKRPSLTVSYGRRVTVIGRLTQGARPVPTGTRVELLEKPSRPGTRETAAGHAKTKSDGTFSIVLATTRSSRTIRLAYSPSPGIRAVSASLRLRVRAASRLHAVLRGRVIRFSGQVLSGPIAKRGKRIQMEGRAPGSAWTAFRSMRTDRRGRFSGSYRLRVRRPGVVLRVRVVVPRENGYGYLSSRSRAVALRVS